MAAFDSLDRPSKHAWRIMVVLKRTLALGIDWLEMLWNEFGCSSFREGDCTHRPLLHGLFVSKHTAVWLLRRHAALEDAWLTWRFRTHDRGETKPWFERESKHWILEWNYALPN